MDVSTKTDVRPDVFSTPRESRTKVRRTKRSTWDKHFRSLVRRDEQLARLIPCLVDGRPSRLFKAQLRNDLAELGISTDDQEFDKFWEKFVSSEQPSPTIELCFRFDTDGFKAVPSEKMLKILFKDRLDADESREDDRRSRSLVERSSSNRSMLSRRSTEERPVQCSTESSQIWPSLVRFSFSF